MHVCKHNRRTTTEQPCVRVLCQLSYLTNKQTNIPADLHELVEVELAVAVGVHLRVLEEPGDVRRLQRPEEVTRPGRTIGLQAPISMRMKRTRG